MPRVQRTAEAQKVDAYIVLIIAEAEFLRANGWLPLSPATPGGDIRWRLPQHGAGSFSQDVAVEKQKRLERA